MRTHKILALAAVSAAIVASPAYAEKGDVLVRVRAIVVSPTERSSAVTPGFPGSKLGVSDAVMPEIDFTYMATKHIGAELILATTEHKIEGRGTLSGVPKIAKTWVLPPTLTLQYHFLPDAKIRPYVGAGVNYTIFYASKADSDLVRAVGPTNVHLSNSFGYALQAGTDIDITKKVFLNLDIKYVGMKTNARLNTGGAINTARVDIDPLIFGIGLGFKL